MTKGKVDALLGIVFGDEGKGKVVDYFTPQYDVVARFAGGPNAGHTIIFEGKKFVLRSVRVNRTLLPSRPKTQSISQSPKRLPSASAGLRSIILRSLMAV